jgi:maltose alpha-D-glucosyltransferase/alpha-amylase
MYAEYAMDPRAKLNIGIRRRLAPLLDNGRDEIELMTAILFSLPGSPILYYGDEIGMGDNVYLGDRDGVRTPMQWSGDRNAGFSRANPQRLYLPVIVDPEYHYEAVNVEAQQGNPSSLLWWTKRLIALFREHEAFGRGDLEFLRPDNPRVLAFLRTYGDQRILVVANLSRYPQFAELDLSAHVGTTPVEMFGKSRFPTVSDRPYPLSFGPHTFLWFLLEPAVATARSGARRRLVAAESWTDDAKQPGPLADALTDFAVEQRWFRGKARTRRGGRIVDVLELPGGRDRVLGVVLEIAYVDGDPDRYFLPIGFATGEAALHLEQAAPHQIVAEITLGASQLHGVLHDALATGDAASAILLAAREQVTIHGTTGAVRGRAYPALREVPSDLVPRPQSFDQSNTTVPFGERLLVKVFRQLEPGINAELEIGEHLAAHGKVARVPPVLGAVTYHPPRGPASALAVVSEFVPNEGSAWDLFTRELEKLFDAVVGDPDEAPPRPTEHVFELAAAEPPAALVRRAATHLAWARQLGRRTAEVHQALAGGGDFAPERFTVMHQQSLFQGGRALMARTFERLARRLPDLPPEVQVDARAALALEGAIEARMRRVIARPLDAWRVRPHGDLHLGQVLFTGDDFVLVDFEGEPARPLSERRYKRNPLRDVAGMLRSFAYAAEASLRTGRQRALDLDRLRPWAEAWAAWTSAAYLAGYLEVVGDAIWVPRTEHDRRLLLDIYAIEKCVYEIGYELGNRPDWLPIPIRGLIDLVEGGTP